MSAMCVDNGAALKTASATASPTMPTDVEVGDILIMHANVSSGTISISANSTGWEKLSQLSQALTNIVESYVWAIRVTDAGMAGPELTRTGGDYMIARIWTIRGVYGETATDGIIGSRNTLSGAGVFTLSHTTFNTSEDDAFIFYVGQTGFDSTGSDMPLGSIDHSAVTPDWWVAPIVVDGTTTGNGGGYSVAFGYKATAGATGQLDWTYGSARSWAKHAFAFRGSVGDSVPPVITATPVDASTIDAADSIQIDVTDVTGLASITVLAVYSNGSSDDVYSDSDFGANFTNGTNAETPIMDGTRLVVARDGAGWAGAAMVLRVTATDVQGNTTVSDFAYTIGDYVYIPPDVDVPVVSLVTPELETELAPNVPVTFRIEDAASELGFVAGWVKFAGDRHTTLVYDGENFVAPFLGPSTATSSLAGKRLDFSIIPVGGWRREIEAMRFRGIDVFGNIDEEA